MVGIGSSPLRRIGVRSAVSTFSVAAALLLAQAGHAAGDPLAPVAPTATAAVSAVVAAAPAVDPSTIADVSSPQPVDATQAPAAAQTAASTVAAAVSAAAPAPTPPPVPAPATVVTRAKTVQHVAATVVRRRVATAAATPVAAVRAAKSPVSAATSQLATTAASTPVLAAVVTAPAATPKPLQATIHVQIPVERLAPAAVHAAPLVLAVRPLAVVKTAYVLHRSFAQRLTRPTASSFAAPHTTLPLTQAGPATSTVARAQSATQSAAIPARLRLPFSPPAPDRTLSSMAAAIGAAGGGSLFVALLVTILALGAPGLMPPLRLPRTHPNDHVPLRVLTRPD